LVATEQLSKETNVFHQLKNLALVATKRSLLGAAAALALVSLSGCVVHEGYYAPPPRRVYYYGPDGRVYVREYPPSESYVVTTPPPAPAPAVTVESPAATALQPLVAPIALYPDPLLAVLLPATTYPQQLQDAGAWLAANPNPPAAAIDAQPWDPSVKALVHYPTVLTQLTGDMQWTQSLGSAFASQPADVSAAIQQMRAQAAAQGNLANTPQQVVVQDGGVIAIEPASTEVIYVPTYDPVLVYVGYHPLFYGDVSYAVGPWFVNGYDWYGGGFIFVGDWHGGYYYHGGYWGRDYGWRGGGYGRWQHDTRFGPPPHIDSAHFTIALTVRGREEEIRRSMVEHAAERHNVQRVARTAEHPDMNRNPNPNHYATPDRGAARPPAEHGTARPSDAHAEGRPEERR
jgi:hypothetical protein